MRASLIIVVLALIAGCTRGPSVRSLPHTTNPIGAQARFSVGLARMEGELIAVPDSGYLVRNSADRLVFIPFNAVRGMRIATVKAAVTGFPSDEHRRALRLASRYPQGVSPDLLRALLARRSQIAVDRLP